MPTNSLRVALPLVHSERVVMLCGYDHVQSDGHTFMVELNWWAHAGQEYYNEWVVTRTLGQSIIQSEHKLRHCTTIPMMTYYDK